LTFDQRRMIKKVVEKHPPDKNCDKNELQPYHCAKERHSNVDVSPMLHAAILFMI